MTLELFRVAQIDHWPAVALQDKPVWIIRGETVEERPRSLRLKTTDPWKASLLTELQKADRLAWVTWMDAYHGDPWLRRLEPDETKFRFEDGRHV